MRIDVDMLEALFDALPDVVFFVKDERGRYLRVNETLTRRCGFAHKRALLGRTAAEVFPEPLGATFAAQDQRVIARGQALHDELELHLFPNRAPGWCLTHKWPIREAGRIVGLIGISRDLGAPDPAHPVYSRLHRAVEHLHRHYDSAVSIAALARSAKLSVAQLERHCKRVFGLTPRRLLVKVRIDAAMALLAGDRRVAEVAHACGYADQSAFTRQFRAVVGITPTIYRRLQHG